MRYVLLMCICLTTAVAHSAEMVIDTNAIQKTPLQADIVLKQTLNLATAKSAANSGLKQVVSSSSLEALKLHQGRVVLTDAKPMELTFEQPQAELSIKLQDEKQDSVFELRWYRDQFPLGRQLFAPAAMQLPGVHHITNDQLTIQPGQAFNRITLKEVQGGDAGDIEYISEVATTAATTALDTNIVAAACQLPLGIAYNVAFAAGLLAIDPATAAIADSAGYTANLALKFCKTILEAPPDLTGRVPAGVCTRSLKQPHMVAEYENALGIPLVFEYNWGELGSPKVYHHNTEVEVGAYFGTPPPPRAGSLNLKILTEDKSLTTDATDLIYQQCKNDGSVETSQLNSEGKSYACPYVKNRMLDFPVGRNTVLWRANTKMGPLDLLPMSIPGVPASAKNSPYKEFLKNVAIEALQIGVDTYLLNGWRWGNVHDDFQVVTIYDEVPPTITPLPQDQTRITTELINDIIHVQIEADEPGGVSQRNYERILSKMYDVHDECDRPVTFNAQYPDDALRSFWPVSTEDQDHTFTLTWSAKDPGPNIGDQPNETTTTMQVEVVDIRAPAIVPPPDIVEVTSNQVTDLGDPLVFDFVDLHPTISHNANLPLGFGLHHVTWTAIDASGNSSEAVQLVNIKSSNINPTAIAQTGSNRRSAISFEPKTFRLRGDDPDDDPLRFYIEQQPENGFFVAPLYPYFVEDFRLQQSATDPELTAACHGNTGPGTAPGFDLPFPSEPTYLTVDDAGNSYVVDNGSISCSSLYDDKFRREQRIAIFDVEGNLTNSKQLGADTLGDVIVDKHLPLIYLTSISGSGSSLVRVLDFNLDQVEAYSLSNLRNRVTGSCGGANGPCEIRNVRSALVDRNGLLLAMDNDGLIYALVKFPGNQVRFVDYVTDDVTGGQSSVRADSLEANADGDLFASRNNRIYKYTPSFIAGDGLAYPGSLRGWMGRCDIDLAPGDEAVCDVTSHRSMGYSCTDDICAIDPADTQAEKDLCGFTFSNTGNFGCRPGQFYGPGGIDIDLQDNLYVADGGNERIQRFTPEGYFAGEARSSCDGSCFVLGDFGHPRDVSVNSDHFYILDPATNLLHVSLLTPFTDIGPDWAELIYQSDNEFACTNSADCIDGFAFSVSDGVRDPNTGLPTRSPAATVEVEVERNFRPPVATPGISQVVLEDVLTPILLDGAELDPLDTLSFVLVDAPEYGSVSIVDNNANYQPEQNYVGSDSFSFAVSDGFSTSEPEQVEVTVLNVNDPPNVSAIENTTIGRGFTFHLAHDFSDPDTDEVHWLNIDWGDGNIEPEGDTDAMGNANGPQLLESDHGLGRISAEHVYTSTGMRTLKVCVSDQMNIVADNKVPTPATLTGCAQATINVIEALDLALTSSISKDIVVPGELLSYEYAVTNLTPAAGSGSPATGVQLTVLLDKRLDSSSISMSGANCNRNQYTVTCDFGTLNAGSSETLNVTAQVPFSLPPGVQIISRAEAVLNETDQTPDNTLMQVTPVVRPGDFYVSSQGDGLSDKPDANPADGICASEDGVCTLRAAIEESEQTAGTQVIVLGKGIYRLESNLPQINGDLILLGNGPSETMLDATDLGGALSVSGGTLRLEGITIANSGGPALQNYGTATIKRARFTNNHAESFFGGAILNSGHLEVHDTTFDGNRSDNDGGAIWNASNSSSTMVNVTAVGNIQSAFAFVGGTHDLTNVTVVGNTGGTGWEAPAAALNVYGGSTVVTLQNTALINNHVGPVGGAPNCVALTGSQLISLGNNVFGDLTGCDITTLSSDVIADDALLLPAANNGSGLLTMMPAENSPLIDHGNSNACPEADARGRSRPADGDGDGTANCDVGAFELQPRMIFNSGFEN